MPNDPHPPRSSVDLDGGSFGGWDRDGSGVPVFRFGPRLPPAGLVVPDGDPDACWHQVANREVTATARAGGGTEVWTARRGVIRLTGARRAWDADGLDPASITTTWGPAFAEWRAVAAGGSVLRRRVTALSADVAALRVDLEVEPGPGGGLPAWLAEGVDVDPLPLLVGALMSPQVSPPPGYRWTDRQVWRALYALSATVRRATDGVRGVLARRLVAGVTAGEDGRAIVVRARRSVAPGTPRTQGWYDERLPDLVVEAVAPGLPSRALALDLDARRPSLRVDLDACPAAADGAVRLAFLLALVVTPAELVAAREAVVVGDADTEARAWCERLRLELGRPPSIPSTPPSPPARSGHRSAASGTQNDDRNAGVVAREATWHAVSLVGMLQPDDWFGARYPAQGSAYGYVHGLQGAPRDYAISAVPLAVIDPDGARDAVRVIARMTRRSGATAYAHTGRGRTTSGGIHAAPTDLALFFLWALTEVVWATGDRALLDEVVAYDPPAAGGSSLRDRALLAHRYVRDRVGQGPHGLLRVGSGDWADPISAMVADRRAFHDQGESGFNTAFAAYVLPRAAALVEDRHPDEAEEMRSVASSLRDAMAAAWNGSWFLRGFDGRGAPIGDRHLFLDGQVWCLIAGIGTEAQRQRLVGQIAERNDRPSPVGATILDRPHPVRAGMLAPGWDCNGGVWAAIGGLLTWGYALHDPALAWDHLQRQTFAAHARAYPHVWYGIWSGPDAYNAHFGSRPGETFVQPATPMTEFPVMNSNAHAGPLLGLLRAIGLETEPSGVVVRPRGPAVPPWRLTTPAGAWSSPA